MKTTDGSKTKLSKMAGRGSPVVLIVYSSETNDSASAIQAAEEFSFQHEHIKFILLNVEDNAKATSAFIQEQGVKSCSSYIGKIPKDYGIRDGAFPVHIVIDEDGKVLLASEDANDYISLVA